MTGPATTANVISHHTFTADRKIHIKLYRPLVFGYILPEEISERWNVSVRQIQILCKTGKINGAVKFGTIWAIPEDAVKPTRTVPVKPGPKPKQRKEE